MDSILTVTVPAARFDLIDLATASSELGTATDASTLVKLQRLITSTSARFAGLCGRPFTLATYSETFRSVYADRVVLSERPVVSVTSVTGNGTVLVVDTDYEIDKKAGAVYRMSNGYRWAWYAHTLTIVYQAGYDQIPADITEAVLTVLRTQWLVSQSVSGASQILRSFSIEGVGREDYWTPTSGSSSSIAALPAEYQSIADVINRYRRWDV